MDVNAGTKASPGFRNHCWSGLRRLPYDRPPVEYLRAPPQRALAIHFIHKRGQRLTQRRSKRSGAPGWNSTRSQRAGSSRSAGSRHHRTRSGASKRPEPRRRKVPPVPFRLPGRAGTYPPMHPRGKYGARRNPRPYRDRLIFTSAGAPHVPE